MMMAAVMTAGALYRRLQFAELLLRSDAARSRQSLPVRADFSASVAATRRPC